ncbi:MAG: hypothetical protein IPJ77_01110 [Planctomycetes bacterium]|nr:hypothetical protein [Planctomycetota bacterium]
MLAIASGASQPRSSTPFAYTSGVRARPRRIDSSTSLATAASDSGAFSAGVNAATSRPGSAASSSGFVNEPGRAKNHACSTAKCTAAQTGACCLADGTCVTVTQADCATQNDTYPGDNTTCATITCP